MLQPLDLGLVAQGQPGPSSEQGYIDTVYLVHRTVLGLSRIYSELSANPVAAIPSLMFVFSLKIWGRRALPVALYPLFIFWAIVYSSHHYVVDAIAGAAYYALSGHPYRLALGAIQWARRFGPQPAAAQTTVADGYEPAPAPSEERTAA